MYKERRVNNVGTVYYTCVGGSSPVEAPITMTDLGGATICGKRGGLSFLDAQRPQLMAHALKIRLLVLIQLPQPIQSVFKNKQ